MHFLSRFMSKGDNHKKEEPVYTPEPIAPAAQTEVLESNPSGEVESSEPLTSQNVPEPLPTQGMLQPRKPIPHSSEEIPEDDYLSALSEGKKTIDIELPEFTINALLAKMIEIGASDLHFETGVPPVYRIRGDIVFSSMPPITSEQAEQLLFPMVSEFQKQKFLRSGNLDFCYESPSIGADRFRVNFLKHRYGLGAVFRLIPSKVPTAESLHLPAVIDTIAMSRKGIVLVTGPTGSGKTTTMAAMIHKINQNKQSHIITIEDPIEFTHQPIKSLISHREIGRHTKSFASALKAALREDPDVILVGEMRDLETISLALTAAQMGILVMGTLHTNSATKTIDRMIDVFPAKQQEQARIQLSQSLRAIIAQQLIKTADGKGRIAAFEILIGDLGLANIIREGKTTQIPTYILMGKNSGMMYMDNSLIELVLAGKIKKEEALIRARDKKLFERAGII